MKIFHWKATVGCKCIADGYLLAENRKEAEVKLNDVPFHGEHEELELDDNCGAYGCAIDEYGVAIRWMDY